MNKGRLLGGLICLVLGLLLGVLALTLPEGKVVFMMGDRNLPIVPVIGLVGLGVALLAAAPRR
jgi:hypothetical protein